jgi:hypothetical protein
MWKDDYLNNLNSIIQSISSGDLALAKSQLAPYLIDLRGIGFYDKSIWKVNWKNKVYDFGRLFQDDAGWVIELINKEIEARGGCEVLDFLYSEIIWNFFDNKNDYVKDEIKTFIKKYPANPEFHHTYSHILEDNGNYEESVTEVKHALSQEKENYIFFYSYVRKVKSYFDNLINNGKLDDCSKLIKKENEYFKSILPSQKDFIVKLNNQISFSNLEDRLKDHISLGRRVEYFSQEIDRKMNIEQRKIIEVLGLFSAILGFILTNITIAINVLDLKDMLMLMFAMSIVLIIFAVTISYLFSKKDRNFKFWAFVGHRKFWTLVILLTVLLSLFFRV